MQVELSKPTQIRAGVAIAEIRCQPCGEITQKSLTIACGLLPPLFLLHNLPADQPVGDDLRRVDRAGDVRAGRFQNLSNAGVDRRRLLRALLLLLRLSRAFHESTSSRNSSCWPGFRGALGRFSTFRL